MWSVGPLVRSVLVPWSVIMSACLSVGQNQETLISVKTAEQIDMPFGVCSLASPMRHVINEAQNVCACSDLF